MKTAKDAVEELRQETREAQRNPRDIFGYAHFGPGFPRLNYAMGGIQKGEMGVLASQMKTGKSMLMTQIIPDLARQAREEGRGRTIDLVILEMTGKAYMRRMAAHMAEIDDPLNIKRGRLTYDEVKRYDASMKELESLPIRYLSNEFDMSTDEETFMQGHSTVSLRAVQEFITPNTFWWCLDHVQLLSDLLKSDLRLGLVRIYKTLQFVCHTKASGIIVTHLTREANGKLPSPTQISESNEGGKAADRLYLLSRPYSENMADLSESQMEMIKMGEPAYLILISRDGVSGLFQLYWNARTARFIELPENAPIDLPGSNKKKKK